MALTRPIQDLLLTPAKDRIEAYSELTGLHVITMDRGDITNEIDNAIAPSKNKIFVVIEVLSGASEDNLATQGLRVALTITENVQANRAQENYMAWDYVLFALLTLFGTPAGNANQELLMRPVSWETLRDTDDQVTVQIICETKLRMERVPTHEPD